MSIQFLEVCVFVDLIIAADDMLTNEGIQYSCGHVGHTSYTWRRHRICLYTHNQKLNIAGIVLTPNIWTSVHVISHKIQPTRVHNFTLFFVKAIQNNALSNSIRWSGMIEQCYTKYWSVLFAIKVVYKRDDHNMLISTSSVQSTLHMVKHISALIHHPCP